MIFSNTALDCKSFRSFNKKQKYNLCLLYLIEAFFMELESCALFYPLHCVACYLLSLKSVLTVHFSSTVFDIQ